MLSIVVRGGVDNNPVAGCYFYHDSDSDSDWVFLC